MIQLDNNRAKSEQSLKSFIKEAKGLAYKVADWQ